MKKTGWNLESIVEKLPEYIEKLKTVNEVLLSNLVMVGEIPAPTFKEAKRVQFMLDRFTEAELQNSSTDEAGNAVAILPGKEGKENILIVAHTDTLYSEKIDHTLTIQPNSVIGPGVGDNSLGVAVILSLPFILEQLNITLDSNLILLGASRSLGRGDLEGLRFFLSNTDIPIIAGVSVEGAQLGRLSYSSIGMIRGEIVCTVPEEYDWSRFGAVGPIVTINEVINQILEIPIPKRPKTTIVFNSIEGGTGKFSKIPKLSFLRFEIRSESDDMVHEIYQRIEDITADVSYRYGDDISLTIYSKRRPGGIEFSHPLTKNVRSIMKYLNIKPRISPSTSELSAFIDQKIPAITLGITKGDRVDDEKEIIEIEPIYTGLAQLVALLLAIDRGQSVDDK
ncbi:MAG: M28 family peptidase [Spirochaetales bacterium]|nr:M28 family peptidase [Spirochaetales bacterium]